ncbi:MAG TPA: DHA2 family efflux MFS transporter permease subunit [Candidatus Acidoferrum sp.]
MIERLTAKLRMPDGSINPWAIAITVTLATFMEVLDTSIANVALPHIAGNLSASADESTWVLTSYLVSNAIVLPLSGWLSSIFGRKRFYMGCVAIFTLSSFLCGFSASLGMLVVFRILQGVGGGGLQPSEQAILNDTFPLEKRGMAFAVYGIAVVVAPTLGPWLGGWITDNYSWRWIFYINVPVGIISLLLTYLLVSDPPYMKRVKLTEGFRVDYVGLGLISLGLGSLQIVLDKGQREDWFASGFIQTFFFLMVVGLIAGVVWELRAKDPVVDFRMLKNRNFAIATTAMFFLGFVLYASTMLIPQMLQELQGYPAELAGLALSPGGAVIMVCMPLVGFLVSRVDTRFLITFGCAVSASSLLVMAGWNLQLDFHHAVTGRMLQAFGLAFLFIPINVSAFAYIPREKTNMGTGIINLARNIGASVGIATVTTLLERRTQWHQARLIDHVNTMNPAFNNMVAGTASTLQAHGATATRATAQAHGMIFGVIQRQAAMLAFLDNFKLLGVIFFAIIPIFFLMRRPKMSGGSVPVH